MSDAVTKLTQPWRYIDGFQGYQVSYLGQVRSRLRGVWSVLQPNPTEKGYLQVSLRKHGRTHCKYVHQLVLEAFVGNCPEGMEARHLNGKKWDNRTGNLCWGTPEDNRNDNVVLGVKIGRPSLDPVTAGRAKALRSAGKSFREIGATLSISQASAWRLCHE